jgi:glycosyltransferase involved in cell wall biosynthesis
VGSVNSERFDTELLLASARAIPDATFVLVGPIERGIADRLEAQGPVNVHVLGARPYEDMPRYVSAFDVGVVPYLLNDFNAGADPIKVYEYLAMGKPVVSVAIPAVEELGMVVTIAHSEDGFIEGIRAALRDREDAPAESRRAESRRAEVARGHSAEVIADRLIALFEDSR